MKKALTKKNKELYFYNEKVKKCIVDYKDKKTYPKNIKGDISEIWGNISGLWGNIGELWGNINGLRGNISGLLGDATNISGDIDDCELTDKDREKGININDLVK